MLFRAPKDAKRDTHVSPIIVGYMAYHLAGFFLFMFLTVSTMTGTTENAGAFKEQELVGEASLW
jgi:hypothetical protein